MTSPRIRCLFVLGTRPEAIKLAPVVAELGARNCFRVQVCLTDQHGELLEQVLRVFKIRPDYRLNVMRPGQSLFDVTTRTLQRIEPVLRSARPDIVFVQGDTTSAFVGALASFYFRVPVAHIEAGLRTYDLSAPFPEELNRRLISPIARFNFAPTPEARRHLLAERVEPESIFVAGNTVIDALLAVARRPVPAAMSRLFPRKPYILVTMHRRESFGEPIRRVFDALLRITELQRGTMIAYPVHPNPNVARPAREILGRHPGVCLLPPLEYLPFVHLLKNCEFALSDSGGIQEEAPALRKPVLVLREKTERPEAVRAGTARLVGTDPERITTEALLLLRSPGAYRRMTRPRNPFGDGRAAARIADFLEHAYGLRSRRPRAFTS